MDADGRHAIRYVDENGKSVQEMFDIVVLSVGLGVGDRAAGLAQKLGVELNHYQYVKTGGLSPVRTSRPGVFVCGTIQAPKDIPSSVIEASAAAGEVGLALHEVRGTLTKTKEVVEEYNVHGEPPRVGVFVCCCGTNIAGFVDVPGVVEFAKTLPFVVYAEKNLFSCSQDTQGQISRIIKEQNLNRVVVSACTPKTHEGLFQETLINAGLNKYLFEMTNIRNQCSWVHKDDMPTATQKAKDLVRMSVAKVALHEPLEEPVTDINQAVLVIGGGVAGMIVARTLSQQGYPTDLVEKDKQLGGRALYLNETWQGEKVGRYVEDLIHQVQNDKKIKVHLNSDIREVDGFVGNFKTTVQASDKTSVLEHGVTIIACGAAEFKPDYYFYGQDDRVLTGLELQLKLREASSFEACHTAVFVQCVGSRIEERPYCSKVCCTRSVKSALELKALTPEMDVFILYRDLRSYGLREDLYRKAREQGIKFIRYNTESGIAVNPAENGLSVEFTDRVLRRQMEIHTDLLILASAMVPQKNNPLAQLYKVAQNDDGFFTEAHVKLRPNDFATDGVFVCGLAHAPKPLDESIVQAQAAASRAMTVLSALQIAVSGTVARVDPGFCSQCGVCISVCPYSAPKFNEKTGIAEIQATLCKGCGLCTASCRSGAIHLKGFETSQIMAMITSCMLEEA
jgi:heterodisulfide reductase subunit A